MLVLKGYRVSIWKDEKLGRMDDGDVNVNILNATELYI